VNGERLVEIGAIHDVETEELFSLFRQNGPSMTSGGSPVLAQVRGRRRRQEPGDRPELALPLQFSHHGPSLP